eukprot:TRINITY_DN2091_c0_g1_i15.p1 TRINITY_DN2091_c0_g1~~TRINITY_DN2091_c0_g1_i15.p1  ORF type:complete len:154 (-),score=31.96 TRINITY_DN2091_c0_g1_i15:88-549(-)
MIKITQNVTGASKVTIWTLPIIALIFFLLPYIPIIGRLQIVFIFCRKIVATYIGVIVPGYETFKTIEKRKDTDPERMLSYWLVLALSYSLTGLLGMFIAADLFEFIFYFSILALTMFNYIGSKVVYRLVVRSFINHLRYTYGSTKPESKQNTQ